MSRGELRWRAFLFVCTVVGFALLFVSGFALVMMGIDALQTITTSSQRFCILMGTLLTIGLLGIWYAAYDWYRAVAIGEAKQAKREQEHHERDLADARQEADAWRNKLWAEQEARAKATIAKHSKKATP